MNEKWYHRTGNMGETVISTRVRLARNLKGFPFPDRMSLDQRNKVCQMVRDALLCSNSAIRNDFDFIEMQSLSNVQAQALAERHLISPEFADNRQGKALLLKKDESVSIMLCEEDHVRIQVMQPGLQLEEAYDLADKIDTLLDSQGCSCGRAINPPPRWPAPSRQSMPSPLTTGWATSPSAPPTSAPACVRP